MQNEGPGPKKRFIFTAISLFSSLVTVGKWVFGSTSAPPQQKQKNYDNEIADIQRKLKLIDGKVGKLAKDVDGLKQLLREGQERLQATCLYGKDVSRLRFFLSYLVNFLSQRGTGLQPAYLATKWADSVLDLGVDGVAQVCGQLT